MASASELCSDILCLLISGSVGLYSILVQLLVSVAEANLGGIVATWGLACRGCYTGFLAYWEHIMMFHIPAHAPE